MKWLERAWYANAPWLIVLWPLHAVFVALAAWRRRRLTAAAEPYPVPVVIVGNISVGGTGKTPLLIALVKHLQAKGLRPGVVSRGYGSKATSFPVSVTASTAVDESGDEALIIARQCGCPVVVDPDRVRAVNRLLAMGDIDVILSDDGLQHYAMSRDIEVVVVDGERRFGNGLCLPAGPLREPAARLADASLVVVNGGRTESAKTREVLTANGVHWASSEQAPATQSGVEPVEGFGIRVEPNCFVNVVSGEKRPYQGAPFKMGSHLHAVSGLGNPQRFYALLEELGHKVTKHSFPDHHRFTQEDFSRLGLEANQPIVMTEKDAVKVGDFAQENYWFLTIRMKLPTRFLAAFDKRLAAAQKARACAAR
ncbi:MAG: tetraacyldisaccharide 4'-kinase [Gammaproteobacteria bacterium]|jgi:tetraacyldisaccharide 4'-kinase|nr:tetraacyldisaccharide 4'-kinase [Gammaproteobacteria bacterium]